MAVNIPEDFTDLLLEPVFVTVGTVLPDGQPHLSVVWCDYDGQHVLVNTARGRRKEKNLLNRPVATVLAVDPKNPYRYLEIRGTVEMTEEGALAHINKLAKKYAGQDQYYGGVAPAEMANQETRVICKITPTKVVTMSPNR